MNKKKIKITLTMDEWNKVWAAMCAAQRGWTADYDYAPDLAEKMEQQVYKTH